MSNVISVLQVCQQIAIAFLIFFFIISVVLFFVFDIRKIFNIRTGRAKRKTVSEMSKANAATGRLRVGGKTVTSELSKEEKKRQKRSHKTPNIPSALPTTEDMSGAGATDVLTNTQYEPLGAPTEKLEPTEGNGETTLLSNQEPYYPTSKFVITKKIIKINTDEIIN
ncbi:MAG: hypothetical protein Q4A46_07295 [Clostridia bacterium]|nr:hypothetical protein [Clostridia bacterium]